MKPKWSTGRSGAWHEDAQDGDIRLGAGESQTNPGKFFWVVFQGMRELNSGLAPTMNSARWTAEYFAQRYAGLREAALLAGEGTGGEGKSSAALQAPIETEEN